MAREGRLARRVGGSYVGVGLNLIDEAVLALVDRALARRSNVTFVYPSPAGEVSVLLAAQILITRLLMNHASRSVGIVTSDTTTVVRTWNQLSFRQAWRASICFRSLPLHQSWAEWRVPAQASFVQRTVGGASVRGLALRYRHL